MILENAYDAVLADLKAKRDKLNVAISAIEELSVIASLSYAEFLQKENSFIQTIAQAMEAVLTDMGEDVKGISWFCSSADSYMAQNNLTFII